MRSEVAPNRVGAGKRGNVKHRRHEVKPVPKLTKCNVAKWPGICPRPSPLGAEVIDH